MSMLNIIWENRKTTHLISLSVWERWKNPYSFNKGSHFLHAKNATLVCNGFCLHKFFWFLNNILIALRQGVFGNVERQSIARRNLIGGFFLLSTGRD